jgi:predicted DNA-binding transcriptional regulator AlpA
MNRDTQEHLAIGRRLLAELNEALAALDRGATVDDVTTMSGKRPGVTTRTDGSLIAWDYDFDGETLVVDEVSFDLIGTAHVAKLAGLARSTVKSHVQRGTIVAPVPVARSNAMVWRRGEIIAWIEMRKRKTG